MKFLKTLLCPFLFICLFSACKEAPAEQGASTPATEQVEQTEKRRTVDVVGRAIERIQKKVTLSPEQIASIKEIGGSFDFNNLTKEELSQRRKAFRQRILEEVLTPEQGEAFDKKK